jgi:hypothetical protein
MNFKEEMAERLKTQDNACTAEPIFVVQQRKRIYGVDPNYTEQIVWLDDESFEADKETAQRLEEGYEESGDEPSNWRRVGYTDEWEFVTVCLTRKGAENFIKSQAHNLKEPRIYVDSGHRNPEWKALRKYFMEDK